MGRRIAAKVAEAHEKLFAAGRQFLGRAAVLAVSFVQRAQGYESRFGVIPTFAAKAWSVRVELARVERYFRKQHRQALVQWRQGVRHVLFPAGTWAMAVMHGAVAKAPGG
jgi:hypothetical protein